MNPYLDRIPIVAKEMQHLLWSPQREVRDGYVGWWNCVDHAVMTGALMWINGYTVDIFGGQAFFAQSRKSSGAAACLHKIPKQAVSRVARRLVYMKSQNITGSRRRTLALSISVRTLASPTLAGT